MNNSILIRRFCFSRFCFAMSVISMVACSSICNAQAINWLPGTGAAVQAAATTGKTIFLHFGGEDCRPCDQLDSFVFSDPTVQRAFAETLLAVKVDAAQYPELVQEFGVVSLPTDVAISPDGQVLLKRKSPMIVASYLKMINDVAATRAKLEDPNSQIENAAYQIQQAAKKSNQFEGQATSYAPEFPYQDPVKPAASSLAVKHRGKLVTNPFVQSGTNAPSAKVAKAPASMPRAQGQILPSPQTAPAPLEMPKPMKMPGQLSMPEAMQLVQGADRKQVSNNDFAGGGSLGTAEGQLSVPNSAKSREQAEQKLADFKADPKVVMDDRFYGSRRAMQAANAIDGNYQAKINLPADKKPVGFVPPQPPRFAGQEPAAAGSGTKAAFASTTSVLKKAGDNPVQRGLEQASETPAKPNYALHGKCPVSLLTKSKWIDGEEEIGCVHRNRIYIFASQENLETFQTDPDAYSPILAGYDPVVFEETGRLVDGMEEYGVFMGKTPKQRIVLFASPETRARFQLEPRKYLQTVRQAMQKSTAKDMR